MTNKNNFSNTVGSVSDRESTESYVERALAIINNRQAHLNPKNRQFTPKEIIAVVQELRPDRPPLHRSTLLRNPAVAQLIATARGEQIIEPDFKAFGGWQPPRSFSSRARAARRKALSGWTLKALAYEVVGLEELEQHAETRRQQLEAVKCLPDQWPRDLPYPLTSFTPSGKAMERYQNYLGRSTRQDMIRMLIDLERLVTEHYAHLLEFDAMYVDKGIGDLNG